MARRALGVVAGMAIGALVAFPLGLLLGRGNETPSTPAAQPVPEDAEALLNPFAPNLLSDPAFVARQRENLEALEQACEASGQFCEEAEAFRRALSAQ